MSVSEAQPQGREAAQDEELLRRITAFVRRRVDDGSQADDVVQEILLRLLSKADTVRDDERIEAWAYQVARSVIADHYRAAGRRAAISVDDDRLVAEPEAAAEAEDGSKARVEMARCVEPLFGRLGVSDREALRASDLAGATQAEAAQELGLSLPAMKARIRRARARLKDELLRCCQVELDAGGRPTDFRPGQGARRVCGDACGSAAGASRE